MPAALTALYPKLIHLLMDTVFVVDTDNRILFVSEPCKTLLGYEADELIGTLISDYMHPEDREATLKEARRVMAGEPHIDYRNRYIRKDGGVVHILWSARWSADDRVRIGVARDITRLTHAEAELRFLAHHDPLTRLTNRALFLDRLETALRSARRREGGLALLFVDIDDFKRINDEHGHAAGDRLLCAVARRLETCVRESDTVARMGGDEFIVLLTDMHSADAVSAKVDQMLQVLAAPLGADGGGVEMPSCSIGVACYPADGEDATSLLGHADGAMYQAKRRRSVPAPD